MSEVVLERVAKVYPDGTRAVDSLDLRVDDGELVVLVGPSGCGKTTALRMVAGLEQISEGTIAIDGRVVNGLDPQDRDVAMVFQTYALYPHMTVAANIGFPLKLAGVRASEREQRVRRVARTLGLERHLERKPRQLSGGQRQRVAMGRAIVREPRLFLMDEPLSNLDAKLRTQMRAEIGALQRAVGVTTLYVTHDQVEAMTLGDRIAVMRGGVLQQYADPHELYARPANLFVAAFIGSPPMSVAVGELVREGDGVALRLGEQRLLLDDDERRRHPDLASHLGRTVIAGVRPEMLEDAAVAGRNGDGRRLSALAAVRESLGSDVLLHFSVPGASGLTGAAAALAQDSEPVEDEDAPELPAARASWIGRFSPETRIRPGESFEAQLSPAALHLFDATDGRAL